MYYSLFRAATATVLVGGGSVLGVWGVNSYSESIGVVNIYQFLTKEEQGKLLRVVANSDSNSEWKQVVKGGNGVEEFAELKNENEKVQKLKSKCQEYESLTSSDPNFPSVFPKFKQFCLKKK